MKSNKILTILLFVLVSQNLIPSYGLGPGDYHQKFWGGGLHVWVSYPEDASPGDTINLNVYILSGKYPRGNQIESVQAKISVLGASTSNVLYDNTLISNSFLQSGKTLNQSIPVTLPSDARWYVTVQMDTVSYHQDNSTRMEAHVTLDCTKVRSNTYQDLERQNQELNAYLNQVNEKISEFQTQLNSIPDDEIAPPQQDYLELLQDYVTLSEHYSNLLQENHTVTDPELSQQVNEMSNAIIELEEEIMILTSGLDEEIGSREDLINALSNENQALDEDLHQQIAEKEEAVESLNIYKETYTVTEGEFHELESRVNSLSYTRTLTTGALIIAIAAAIAVYLKLR
jgi:hypothetical protein